MPTVTQVLMELCRITEEKLNAQNDANVSAIDKDPIDKFPIKNQPITQTSALPKNRQTRKAS